MVVGHRDYGHVHRGEQCQSQSSFAVFVEPGDRAAAAVARDAAENPNRPLQRDWLLEVTAHREMEAFDRAIDLRITRLRRKIEPDPTHPDAIRTVRGVGYMFVPPSG